MRGITISALTLVGFLTLKRAVVWCEEPWPIRRVMPEFYTPGEGMEVGIWYIPFSRGSEVHETIPKGWTVVWMAPPPPGAVFDEGTNTIHWYWALVSGIVWTDWICFWYKVIPPAEQTGEVRFGGYFYRPPPEPGYPPDPELYLPIAGDKVISDVPPMPQWGGKFLYVPEGATIQPLIDGAQWWDTVVVPGREAPFVENIVMKAGVNLRGSTEYPNYRPPVIQSASASFPAIVAARYTKISGLIICSGLCGVQVKHPTVEISDCVITGTESAAIEYVGTTEGRVTNCTIVGNAGAGVLCREASPGVVVSNSIFFGNGGSDAENCTVRFSLLEDETQAGWGDNNIRGDPMFVGAAEGDYRLVRGSPCIDAGDNGVVRLDGTDVLGRPRVMFAGRSDTVDLGAYEYWLTTACRKPGPSEVELSWSSRAGKTYSVLFCDDMLRWELADDNVPGAGAITVWRDPIGWPRSIAAKFYRVTENE